MKHKAENIISKALEVLELVIAGITLVALIAELCMQLYHAATTPGFLNQPDFLQTFLHEVMTLIVGLEFVKMLVHLTPENTIEVLIMATSRHIIINHGEPLDTLIGIVCVVALFATRRYFVARKDLNREMTEIS